MTTPRTERYDAGFYADQVDDSARAAAVILPIVFGALAPARVIDIGCGQGAWLAAAGALGATTLTGLDGAWVERDKLREPRITFHPTDLAVEFARPARHDLCISVEVAEHLPVSRAEGFVAACCAAADAVVFSAAVPLQGGTEHVNEQRASRWAARFAAQGFDAFDVVRARVWEDARVSWWYRQNVVVYAKRDSAAHRALASMPTVPPPFDLIHPEGFEAKLQFLLDQNASYRTRLDHPTWRQAFGTLLRAMRAAPPSP
jgi:SAM-dependent methyltransferase